MNYERRLYLYQLQNGTRRTERLTSRQRRRLRHKADHMLAPFGKVLERMMAE